jgi:DNA polymerase-4
MVLLVDMDAFFASVEQAHHPALRGKPVIVCGDPERRGVVTAASYEARPSGVRAGMPLARARRLCPDAHYVEGNPAKYVAVSLALLDLYTRWTPLVEPFSVDEAFMGLQGTRHEGMEGARRVAGEVQEEIRKRFSLSASVGAGPSKLVAKMAAGLAKPGGIAVLDVQGYRTAFWARPVRELWGVGEHLEARLHRLGIRTVGDLALCPAGVLADIFGVLGPPLRDAARGEDRTPLVPYYQGVEAKSMGHEVTLSADCHERGVLEGVLLRLCDQVARRMRQEGFVGRVVALKLRDASFKTRIRQCALEKHGDDADVFFRVAKGLMDVLWDRGWVRLLGVTVSQLARAPHGRQVSVFPWEERAHMLRSSVDELRDRFGEACVVRAGALRRLEPLRHVPFGAVRPRHH